MSTSLPAFGDQALQDYIHSFSQNVSSISQAVQALYHPGLDHPLHSFLPGDWVLMKFWTNSGPLAEQWKGPFLVLLMTHMAVKVAGICTWIHHSCLKTSDPLEDSDYHWTVAPMLQLHAKNTKRVASLPSATQ